MVVLCAAAADGVTMVKPLANAHAHHSKGLHHIEGRGEEVASLSATTAAVSVGHRHLAARLLVCVCGGVLLNDLSTPFVHPQPQKLHKNTTPC